MNPKWRRRWKEEGGIGFEMDSMKINDRSVRPLAFGFDKGRTSRLELVLSPRPHLASHRYNNTEARSHSLVRVSARRCNSMRDTWKWKTIRAHPSLVFLDYPISSITVASGQNWTYCVYNYVRARASPRPCFQYSLFVVIRHVGPERESSVIIIPCFSRVHHHYTIDSTKLGATESEKGAFVDEHV